MAAHDFVVGSEFSNAQITTEFGGSQYRALRVSEKKKTIVLLMNFANDQYFNHWKGNVLYFSAFENRQSNQQGLDYYPNRYLFDAKDDGFKVLLFERYFQKQGYIFRGEVEVRGVGESPIKDYEKKGLSGNPYFILHPIRRQLAGNFTKVMDLQLEIQHDNAYWDRYLLDHGQYLIKKNIKSPRDVNIIDSLWRAYASEVIETFSTHVESLVPGIVIPEYELERGSIKSVLPILATVATIAGGTSNVISNYPEIKKNFPIVVHDAEIAFAKAVAALEQKFPGLRVLLESGTHRTPHRPEYNQPWGPPLTRQEKEALKSLGTKKK